MKLLTALTIVTLSATSFADTLIVTANPTSWSPAVANCYPGDVLRFEYGGGYPHTITSGSGCTYDGVYFDEPLSSPGAYYEWTVPSEGPAEIPFFCDPHCNNGMTGVIVIDLPLACPADTNGDGTVNVTDILAVVGAWGESGGPADINGDGVVDVTDLLTVVNAWGACPE
jgi:plastocyanin